MDGVILGLDVTLERQSQIITRRQLLDCAIHDLMITRRVKAGRWQRVLPGVYLIATVHPSTEQRRIAAGLYAGPLAQVTGQAALHWHGFRYAPASDRVHMLIPHERRRRSVGFVLIQRTHELDSHARQTEHYWVASPGRAVVDACRVSSDLRTARAIMAEAVQRSIVSLDTLDEEIRRASRSRTAIARRVFAELLAGVRSSPEAELRELIGTSDVLPRVLWNPRLFDPDGQRLPTPDGWIPDVGIALEVDSREFHSVLDGWAQTLSRSNRLAEYEVRVLHFTPREIREEPDRILRAVERAYLTRRASGVTADVSVGAPL